ncbi:MAG TPA: transglutaminase-like domain-containing protein [Candidatus Polarisedimenticolia bacterium]|nr:transglutaminase-like domain-containing protein [Candidatus Polarisedimenticolia bacterium]
MRRGRGIGIIIAAMGVTLERRTGRWTFALILVGLAGVGAAALAYLTSPIRSSEAPAATAAPTDPVAANRIHVPMFVDPALVRPTPRFRFTFDPPEVLAPLRLEEGLDAIVGDAPSDLQRCAALMRWARAQWEPGIPNPYPPLDARIILRDIRRGFTGGFCAQYNYVLAQALQSFGIPARYVSLIEHEVIEARLPDAGRWVCLDPLYDAWYADDAGTPLSVHEIHTRLKRSQEVTPSPGHRIKDLKAHWSAFASFAVWLKNDHVSAPVNFTDLERYKVHFLDEPAGASGLAPGALATAEPADLYPG